MTVAGLTTLATLWVPGTGYHNQGLILVAIAIGAIAGTSVGGAWRSPTCRRWWRC